MVMSQNHVVVVLCGFFLTNRIPTKEGAVDCWFSFECPFFSSLRFTLTVVVNHCYFFMDVSQTCGGGRSLGLFLRCFPKLAICVNYCNSAVMLKTTNSLTTVSPPNRAE